MFGGVQAFAQGIDGAVGATNRSWIDEAVPANDRVAFLFGGAPDPAVESVILWETEFWNRRLSSVYYLGQAETAAALPYLAASFDPPTGRIALAGAKAPRYVVAPSTLKLVGRKVAATSTLALYEVRSPLRLGETVEGIYPDRWMGSDAALTRYVPSGKRIHVTLSRTAWGGPDAPGKVRIAVGPVAGADGSLKLHKPTALRTWTIHSGAQKTFTLPTPTPPYRLEIHIEPTFSPSQFGQPDTRQLGAQVFFGP